MLREMVGGSLRGGLYLPIRDELVASGWGPGPSKASAGLLAGLLSGIVSNPLEVVKIRLLANGTAYQSALLAVPRLIAEEGLRGYFRGLGLSVSRAAVINMGYLGCYDYSKVVLLHVLPGPEGSRHHVAASLATGLVAATVSAPLDLLKTRAMHSTAADLRGATSAQLRHVLQAKAGALGLFRGWLPAYLRLGPHTLICFPIQEQVRAYLGLSYI